MNTKFAMTIGALLVTSACQHAESTTLTKPTQSDAEIATCVRTVMKLNEGRWAYMGTIGRGNGKFRTYETTSVLEAAGTDTWMSKSFGGDVGGEEETAEIGYVKLVNTSIIPTENDQLKMEEAVKYTSCVGPDAEGRYEATLEYSLPHDDGTRMPVDNLTWFSEHGSYYVEDIYHISGRVIARRSGVYTPAGE